MMPAKREDIYSAEFSSKSKSKSKLPILYRPASGSNTIKMNIQEKNPITPAITLFFNSLVSLNLDFCSLC